MKRCLAILLLWPMVAWAEAFNLCVPGDIQTGTRCCQLATAWEHQKAAIDRITGTSPSPCDFVILPGDLVEGAQTYYYKDCWCAAQEDGCEDLTTHPMGITCLAADCNDAEAKICAIDGVVDAPGYDCEWERARWIADELESNGIPWAILAGNHDGDPVSPAPCDMRFWATYNRYFGSTRLTELADESGSISVMGTCSGEPGNIQPTSSYQVITAAGAQWLHIALSESSSFDGVDVMALDPATIIWVKGVLDDHEGMPTIISAHMVIDNAASCTEADYENAWCYTTPAPWSKWWAGRFIYDELLQHYPQIFLVVGGHIRQLRHVVTANTPHRVIGAAIDYTNHVTDAPGWQIQANGGGGTVTVLRIDPVTGWINSTAYSAKEDEFVRVRGEEGSRWRVSMPLCSDGARFEFPAAACPEPEPSPECCRK